MVPDELRYTAEHEWIAVDESGRWRVGITHFAQDALGDIVFVQLPAAGTEVTAGESMGEIESTKSVSELYAPVSGTVAEVNSAVADSPEVVNSDPYGRGWLVELTPTTADTGDGLLDAGAYRKLTDA